MQLGAPVHVTPHALPAQLTRAHVLTPVQTTVVKVALLVTSALHARGPEHSTVHVSPVHATGCVHESAPGQRSSHVEASHVIGPVHVSATLHPSLHLLPPHPIRFTQEPAPSQLMTHALAALQSIVDVHEPAPVHVTVHGMPEGQTMGPVHVPAAVHTTAHEPAALHVPTPASAQMDGHISAASLAFASPAPASVLASRR
ncbi:MAG: hypothetical protein JWP87_2065 [Labilithrix sp.]|nr:hypothetical protein [Labilithrix sp.]